MEDLHKYGSENIEDEDLNNEDFSTGPQNNTEETDESDNSHNNEEDDTNIENPSDNEAPVSPKNLEQQIVDKYTSKFLALKNESLSRLNALLSQAKQEYNDTPKNKKSAAKIALGYKYLRLGRNLEKEIDAKFNSILSDMRNELKRNSLPTTSVDEARKVYNNEKK